MTAGTPRVDPALRARLDAAGGDERIEAVVMLTGASASVEPDEVRERVSRLLREVAEETDGADYEFNVFGYLGSFAIAAFPALIEDLLQRPEVESARSNRRA